MLTSARRAAARYVPSAALTAAGVEIGIRLVPLPRLAAAAGVPLDLAASPAQQVLPSLGPADDARLRASRWVLRRWPWGRQGPCLREALVAGHLLRHRRPQLRLGATRGPRGATAHAWLVIDGAPLETGTPDWTPLLRPRSS